MSTGIESWNVDLTTIGPMYPFVGTETILVLVAVGAWLLWHIVQARIEAREVEAEAAKTADAAFLRKALDNNVEQR